MTPAEELGALIRNTRKQAGLSQEKLAYEADLSIKTISTLETGKWAATPKPQTLRRIAEALGLDPEDLIRPLLAIEATA